MHRATPNNSSFRAYVAGGARSVIHEVDDSKEMQEGKGGFLKGEQREGVESPQNYGFTSVTMDADKDGDGNVTDGPETFVSFVGGNRALPSNGPIDDRRHRLKGLEKGDVAMFRTKDDNQQFHLTEDGGFWSAPTDKTVRMQLVKKQQQQQQGGQGAQAGTHAANGSGGTSGQQGQQGQQSQRGQKAVRKNSSHQFVECTQDNTNVSGTNTKMMLQDGKGYLHCSSDKKVWVGAEKGKAPFARLLTENGPAVNSYGALSPPSLLLGPDGNPLPRVDQTTIILDPPPEDATPPPDPDFPPPVIPDRCFYTETTWHDAHTAADAWDDFSGNHGHMIDPHTPEPFKFQRAETSGYVPNFMKQGALGLNAADGILFWLNAAGALAQANLNYIANVPGLLALHQITAVTAIQDTQRVTLDPRTNYALVIVWGGSAGTGVPGGGPGSNGQDGGTTNCDTFFYAEGGKAAVADDADVPAVPGSHGNGVNGFINLTGCGAASPPGGNGGNGGLAIRFFPTASVGGGLNFGIGWGGAAGSLGGHPGAHGGALMIEFT